ncbi:tetratricopeptide repeat protein [Flavihumibacter solisilvae]|uniref:Tetratricopeptide repeat protein n=1 Tax=Flavihumibacter solisilvae TaxID=1349421 RepID=A0A0C1IJW7_9BACT|nr:tetratricopeptide repeat protein [Flavihumibacter solisilvae]KIC94470.1 hypothetical protein OI18_11350 [Flavihumibacter solisilvae]
MLFKVIFIFGLLICGFITNAQEEPDFKTYFLQQAALLEEVSKSQNSDKYAAILQDFERTYQHLKAADKPKYRTLFETSNAYFLYDLSRIFSLKNSKKVALDYLDKALRSGFIWDSLRFDEGLNNIRQESRYEAITTQLFQVQDCWARADKAKQGGMLDSMLYYGREGLRLTRMNMGQFPEDILILDMVNLAYLLWWAGDYPSSLETNFKALAKAEKLNDPFWMARAYNGIAMVYRNQGQYREAIGYFTRAEEVSKDLPDRSEYFSAVMDKGKSYEQLDILDSAYDYVQKWLTAKMAMEKTPDPFTRPDGSGGGEATLAIVYSKRGEEALATEYFRKAFQLNTEAKNFRLLARSYLEYAEHFDRYNESDSAIYYATKGYNLDQANNFLVYQIAASKLLSALYDSKRNSDSAYKYQKKMVILQDSLFNSERISRMQMLSLNEQLRQQQVKAEMAENAAARDRNIQYLLIAVVLVTGTVLFLLLSRSFITSAAVIKFLGVVGLLLVFEFINLLLHPYLDKMTQHSPVLMLLALAAIASMLVPLHHKLEKWTSDTLVEKNRKARLAKARKTIEVLSEKEDPAPLTLPADHP